MKKKISIIVPCYNEEEALPIFYKEIKKIEEKMNYLHFEYIFVNDGSKDKTLDILRKLSKKDDKVRYISFSRNFGKEAAMLAGLEYSSGDYVTIMDADLAEESANYVRNQILQQTTAALLVQAQQSNSNVIMQLIS